MRKTFSGVSFDARAILRIVRCVDLLSWSSLGIVFFLSVESFPGLISINICVNDRAVFFRYLAISLKNSDLPRRLVYAIAKKIHHGYIQLIGRDLCNGFKLRRDVAGESH